MIIINCKAINKLHAFAFYFLTRKFMIGFFLTFTFFPASNHLLFKSISYTLRATFDIKWYLYYLRTSVVQTFPSLGIKILVISSNAWRKNTVSIIYQFSISQIILEYRLNYLGFSGKH